jgi:3',5'-cyclic AMP phosphodiesterase CpdA
MKLKKLATIFVLIVLLLPSFSRAQKIGWVTDIHAGAVKKKKKSATNIFHPRYYRQYLDQALIEMQSEGIDLLVISGDVTDKSKQTKYARRVRALVREKGMELVWARGNHDNEETVEKYMDQEDSYYHVDRYDWRFIALDNSQRLAIKEGGMKSVEQEWLEDLLEETDKSVLVAMHYPFQNPRDGSIYKVYREAEELFSGGEKVKLALAGHWHAEYFTTLHDVKYAVGNPLTLDSRMGSYYVVDLDTLWVEARQAQIPASLKKKSK